MPEKAPHIFKVTLMSEEKKSLFHIKLPKGNPTHATIMAVAGAYVIYMAYQMLKNTLSGNSTMSLNTTYILSGLMALGGLAVIGYGVLIWINFAKKDKKSEKEEQITDDP